MTSMYDITIIGAGAYGTAILGQLSLCDMNKKQQQSFRILVVERSEELGPGMPYSMKTTIPDYIVNIAGGCTQITATYIPLSERSDFLMWLRSLTKEYRVSIEVDEEETPQWLHRPFPRFVVGLYLSDRFKKFVKSLRSKGFQVDVQPSRNALSLTPNEEFGYEIELENGKSVQTRELFLATGHWSYNRFPSMSQWIDSPYILHTMDPACFIGKGIGILGCSLSAIDAVLAVSGHNGIFEQVDKDKPTERMLFIHNKGAENFKITMYGRRALLPQVMGVVVNKIFKYKHLTPESFIPIIKRNEGFLPLDEFWNLLKKEIYEEVPQVRHFFPVNWKETSLEEAIEGLRDALDSFNHMERLKEDLIKASESLKTGIPLRLQNVFYQSYAIFDEVLSYFSAEDRIRFEEIKTELHILIAPFPVQNAEKILALFEGGYLNIQKLGNDYEISKDCSNKEIQVAWTDPNNNKQTSYHNMMIDATGQKADFKLGKNSLTKSLQKHKLLKEILVPFKTSSPDEYQKSCRKVVHRNGVYYYRPDGAEININNFSLVPDIKRRISPIYYMGPLTMGQVAFPQDMSAVTAAAERGVSDMVKRKVLMRKPGDETKVDPMPMYDWVLNAKGDINKIMGKMTDIMFENEQ